MPASAALTAAWSPAGPPGICCRGGRWEEGEGELRRMRAVRTQSSNQPRLPPSFVDSCRKGTRDCRCCRKGVGKGKGERVSLTVEPLLDFNQTLIFFSQG